MKTHWKKLTHSDYLGSWDLAEGEQRSLTITKIEEQNLKASPQAEEEPCVIFHYKGSKPMVMNKTNLGAVEKYLGTPYVEEWMGKTIVIHVEKGVKAFGKVVDALRVLPDAPKPKAAKKIIALEVGDANWNRAIKYVEGNVALGLDGIINQLSKKYTISEEVRLRIAAHMTPTTADTIPVEKKKIPLAKDDENWTAVVTWAVANKEMGILKIVKELKNKYIVSQGVGLEIGKLI